jgi:hypothetical protein
MANTTLLRCDGCGQLASSEHLAKRLQRLEWTTRYRPLHVGTLLLGAISPANDSEFLYSERGEFAGEAQRVLEVAGISSGEKSAEAILTEFQRGGFLLTHVLECPLEPSADSVTDVPAMLAKQFPFVAARVRRSLKPKRVVPISQWLGPSLGTPEKADLGCPIILEGIAPFALDGNAPQEAIARLRNALAAAGVAAR